MEYIFIRAKKDWIIDKNDKINISKEKRNLRVKK